MIVLLTLAAFIFLFATVLFGVKTLKSITKKDGADKKNAVKFLCCSGVLLFVVVFSVVLTNSDDSKIEETGNKTTFEDSETETSSQRNTESIERVDNENQSIEEYEKFLSANSDKISSILKTFGVHFQNYSTSQKWKSDTTSILFDFREAINEAMEYKDVPKIYDNAHREYMFAMNEFMVLVNGLPAAIDNEDAEEVSILTRNMDRGKQHIELAGAEILKVKGQ